MIKSPKPSALTSPAPATERRPESLVPTRWKPSAPSIVARLRLAPKPAERVALRALRAVPAKPVLERALFELAKNALERTPNTMLFNMTGQPAMSVPLHWGAGSLPIGVQFVGKFGDEETLLGLAGQLESLAPRFFRQRWFRQRAERLRLLLVEGEPAAGELEQVRARWRSLSASFSPGVTPFAHRALV